MRSTPATEIIASPTEHHTFVQGVIQKIGKGDRARIGRHGGRQAMGGRGSWTSPFVKL